MNSTPYNSNERAICANYQPPNDCIMLLPNPDDWCGICRANLERDSLARTLLQSENGIDHQVAWSYALENAETVLRSDWLSKRDAGLTREADQAIAQAEHWSSVAMVMERERYEYKAEIARLREEHHRVVVGLKACWKVDMVDARESRQKLADVRALADEWDRGEFCALCGVERGQSHARTDCPGMREQVQRLTAILDFSADAVDL